MHVPMESKKEGTTLEEDENNENSKEVSCDYCSVEKSEIRVSDDGNDNGCVDARRMHDRNGNERNQCTFEMIDNISNTMKKLET